MQPSLAKLEASDAVAGRTPSWHGKLGHTGLGLILLLLSVRFAVMAPHRALEFDQLLTILTAKAHSWHAYIAAVPADAQPPFTHVAARLGLFLPLPEALGVHLCSALAIGLAAVCLYRVFARRGAPLAGLCAAAFFAASRCVEYMFSVRPYADLIGIAALSVAVYDTYRIRRAAGQQATLWPIAVLIVVASTVHALGIIYVLAPVIAGELLYWYGERRVDRRLWLAVALASTSFVYDVIFALEVQHRFMSAIPVAARVPGRPTAAKLTELLMFPAERRWQVSLLASLLLFVLLGRRRSNTGSPRGRVRGADLGYPLAAAMSLYLAGMVGFAMGVANHYFFTRYASPVFLSGALLLGVLLSTATAQRYALVPVAIAAGLLMLPGLKLRAFLRGESGYSPREESAAVLRLGDVIASPLAYLPLWWYATPEERTRMRALTDPVLYRTIPDGLPEAVLRSFDQAGVLPFHLTPLDQFYPTAKVTLVRPIDSGDSWVPSVLERQGFRCARDRGFPSEAYEVIECVQAAARH